MTLQLADSVQSIYSSAVPTIAVFLAMKWPRPTTRRRPPASRPRSPRRRHHCACAGRELRSSRTSTVPPNAEFVDERNVGGLATVFRCRGQNVPLSDRYKVAILVVHGGTTRKPALRECRQFGADLRVLPLSYTSGFVHWLAGGARDGARSSRYAAAGIRLRRAHRRSGKCSRPDLLKALGRHGWI